MVFKMGRQDVLTEGDSHAASEETAIVASDTHNNSLVVARMQSQVGGLS